MMRTRDLGILCAIGTVIMAIVWYSLSVTSTSEDMTAVHNTPAINHVIATCTKISIEGHNNRLAKLDRVATQKELDRLDRQIDSCHSIERVTAKGDRNDND